MRRIGVALVLILTLALSIKATVDMHCLAPCISAASAAQLYASNLSTERRLHSITNDEKDVSTSLSALLALKQAISDDTTDFLAMWNTSLLPNYCSWRGVRCSNGTQNVIALLLDSKQLKGTLPPELKHLSHLSYLNLSSNSFQGQIPSEWGELSSLTHLDLSVNQLSGTIPAALANCTRLQYIDFALNAFSGKFPSFVILLSDLIYIDLSDNSFWGEELPPDFGRLSNLQFLQLLRSNLSGRLPPSIANCTGLVLLDLTGNNFSGALPSEWSKLSSIQQIFLTGNSFTGNIPPTLGNCTTLVELALSINSLTGELPASLGNLGMLQALGVLYNRISGVIPTALMNCTGLVSLQLAYNELSGPIPSSTGQLKQLEALSLSGNANLSGQLPVTIGNCVQLQTLGIRFTKVGGPLPMSLYNLSNLQSLWLSSSRFSGSLPGALANLTTLRKVFLDGNAFVGMIPTGLGELKELLGLDLHQNGFQGPIPERLISRSKSIFLIDLSFNLLSGGIPAALGQLPLLSKLYLQNNHLSGGIPNVFSGLTELLSLDLSHNKLTGTIPPSLPASMSLDLSFNNLTGLIPASIGNMRMLITLKLAGNHLTGGIPDTLGACETLETLDLSMNGLTGEINPSIFVPLVALQYLDLSHNSLGGDLPVSLGGLQGLVTLNVSHNALQGMIPSTGIYNRSSAAAFLGNPNLCGYPLARLSCPSSYSNKSTSRSTKFKVILICSILGGILVSSVCIYLALGPRRFWLSPFCVRNRNRVSVDLDDYLERLRLLNQGLRAWTARELGAATNGFDSANLIGSGGASACFKGTVEDQIQGGTMKLVAIKRLAIGSEDQREEEGRRSFMQELKTLCQVRHRNLVSIWGYCMDEELVALVLEFMEKGSLHDHLHSESKSLSWAERLSIAEDVAEGLVYLHHEYHQPIVHCDLKPANILLGSDMVAKIADFGISKLLDCNQSREAFCTGNQFKGTFGYAAPECAAGWRISTKADVYSYGVLLLELMTGMKPSSSYLQARGITLHTWATQFLIKSNTSRHTEVTSNNFPHEHILEQDPVALQQLQEVLELAARCTHEMPRERPSMKYVRKTLVEVTKPHLCRHLAGPLEIQGVEILRQYS